MFRQLIEPIYRMLGAHIDGVSEARERRRIQIEAKASLSAQVGRAKPAKVWPFVVDCAFQKLEQQLYRDLAMLLDTDEL